MANSDSSYVILRYDPVVGTLQYFSGADWYGCSIAALSAGAVTPASISTAATDDFVFPRKVAGTELRAIDLAGNATVTVQGASTNTSYFGEISGHQGIFDGSAAPVLIIGADGSCATGSVNAVASAQFAVVSTAKGFLPPVMTTTQRDAISAPAEGLVIYNSSTHKLNVRTAAAWEEVTSAA